MIIEQIVAKKHTAVLQLITKFIIIMLDDYRKLIND